MQIANRRSWAFMVKARQCMQGMRLAFFGNPAQ